MASILKINDSSIRAPEDGDVQYHLFQVVLQVQLPDNMCESRPIAITMFVLAPDKFGAISQAACHLERSGMKTGDKFFGEIAESAQAIQLPLLVRGWGMNIH